MSRDTFTNQERAALAQFVALIRRRMPSHPGEEWYRAGIDDVLARAAAENMAEPEELAHAMLRLAFNPAVRSPGLLLHEGPHWRQAEGAVRIPEPEGADRCAVCSRSKARCEAAYPRSHAFVPDLPAPAPTPEQASSRRELIESTKAELLARKRAGRRT